MKKSRFIENAASIDKGLLRLKRKEIVGYSIFFVMFVFVPNAMLRAVSDKTFTVLHILAFVLLIFVILAAIFGIKSLYSLTKMMYANPIGYFIAYLVLIFLGGFVMGFFIIFGLLSLWFEVKAFLKCGVAI